MLPAIVEWPFLLWAPHHPVLAVVLIAVFLVGLFVAWRFFGYPTRKG